MENRKPKQGDEQLGIVTRIREKGGNYWALVVPGLPEPRRQPGESNAYLYSRKKSCPVQEQQICMFRYMQWSMIDGPLLVWQPLLDYFESNR